MKNYERIAVVDNISMLTEGNITWNLDLINHINQTKEKFIIPESKAEYNTTSCRWQIIKDSVNIVSDKKFLKPIYPFVPLLFGSQFGLQNGGLKAHSLNEVITVAVLGKSLLSGHVSGLSFGCIDCNGNYIRKKNVNTNYRQIK